MVNLQRPLVALSGQERHAEPRKRPLDLMHRLRMVCSSVTSSRTGRCVDALAPERAALRDAFHPVRPAMALEYRERSTLGTGWALEVCSSGVLVGHIQFGAGNLSGTTKARRELHSRRR